MSESGETSDEGGSAAGRLAEAMRNLVDKRTARLRERVAELERRVDEL